MENKKTVLSINRAIQTGWEATSRYIGFYVTLVLILVLFSLIPSVTENAFAGQEWITSTINALFVVLIALVTLGMVRTSLKSVDRQEPTVKELFHTHLFFHYIAAAVLYLALFIGGLVLFVVPGIYWGLKYQFATYLVIDKRLKLNDAFEESARMVKGHEWDLFAYWLVMFLLNLFGLAFFIVGIVITLPVTIVGYSYLYRELRDDHFPSISKSVVHPDQATRRLLLRKSKDA